MVGFNSQFVRRPFLSVRPHMIGPTCYDSRNISEAFFVKRFSSHVSIRYMIYSGSPDRKRRGQLSPERRYRRAEEDARGSARRGEIQGRHARAGTPRDCAGGVGIPLCRWVTSGTARAYFSRRGACKANILHTRAGKPVGPIK